MSALTGAIHLNPWRRHLAFARRDDGWTLIEALLSVVLMSIVFLGFTVVLLSFREWLERTWAVRLMDQYAHDLSIDVDKKLRRAVRIEIFPSQYGLGSFRVTVPRYDFHLVNYNPALDSSLYTYSAKPTEGVFVRQGNAAPQKFDNQFPPTGWEGKHNFSITQFGYLATAPYLGTTPNDSAYFNSIGTIRLAMRYERPRREETPEGLENRTYGLEKNYMIATYMKNVIDRP